MATAGQRETQSEAAAIFADAKQMQEQAIGQLEQGDIRDASEKAWCATKLATDALILARTGDKPEKTPATSRMLDYLGDRDTQIKTLVGRYYSRQSQLHGDCFYLGLCDPMDTTLRRIRETNQYIQDVERIAAIRA